MMPERREAKYREGQEVLANVELYNDGSHPDAAPDQLLVVAGCAGEVVQVGHHADANVPLYMVDFGLCVLGCLEEEIRAPHEPAPPADEADAPLCPDELVNP